MVDLRRSVLAKLEAERVMMGAIAGDIIGSYYEGFPTNDIDFTPLFHRHCQFTESAVLTVAVADWMMTGGDLVGWKRGQY